MNLRGLIIQKARLILFLIGGYLMPVAGQCDLDLYGMDNTQAGRVTINKVNHKTGRLTTTFDSMMPTDFISAGSHILMNNNYYFVQNNEIYVVDVNTGKLISQQNFLSRSLRFMESSPCDSLIIGMGFQSIRGPAFLNVYDPYSDQLTQVTPQSNLLDIQLDANSIHTKLNDNYILVANGQLYTIDLYSGQIVNQFDITAHNMISYVADPATNLLYGIEITPTGIALKSLDPITGDVKLINTIVKRLQLISKSAHIITDGHYYTMIDQKYFKLDLADGQIVDQYDIHPNNYKFVEINNSCIPLINEIKTTDTSCGQKNGIVEIIPTDPSASLIYNWLSDIDKFTTDEKITNNLAPGDYTLVTTTADGTCKETTQTKILDSDSLTVKIEQTDLGCDDEPVGEINIIIEGQTNNYQFSINDGVTFQAEPNFTSLDTGLYQILIKGNDNCTVTDSVNIEAPDKLEISLGEGFEIPLGEEITLEPKIANTHQNIDLTWTSNNPQYKISCTDCEMPTIQPLSETTYYLNTFDINTGCITSDSITYQVRRNKREVYIPNIFSPNGDGDNDEFGILGGDVAAITSLSIYDRWGMRLMHVEDVEPDDPDAFWDGTASGQSLEPNTYSYLAQVRYLDGLVKIVKGQVILVK